MVWYGMVWYGMVWYGMVWYGMVWFGFKALAAECMKLPSQSQCGCRGGTSQAITVPAIASHLTARLPHCVILTRP